ENNYGQLGDGTQVSRNEFLQEVPSGRIAVAVGGHHTVVLQNDGSLQAVGFNGWGELGDATTVDRNSFVQVVPIGSGMVPSLPTPFPTTAMPSAAGDPHLQNIHGERFDLMNPGRHVLINIPRAEGGDRAMFRLQADVFSLATNCGDLYFISRH
ncbi:unnamed protein product, partial [Prorocentrum cordatum]